MGARLGQHFLTAQSVARKVALACAVQKGETIVEVGPGTGMLTRELLATGANVVAIEKDEQLAQRLHETFRTERETGQFRLLTGDIRDFTPERTVLSEYVVAANIPYYITGEIIRQFLTARHQPRAMALLIQKEVAQRIVARDGKESILSLSVKAYGTPSIIAKVSAGSFSPPPKVDSAIILIEHISRSFFSGFTERHFFEILHAGFAARRKKLSGNLAKVFGQSVRDALADSHIPENARAEDLVLAQWAAIATAI